MGTPNTFTTKADVAKFGLKALSVGTATMAMILVGEYASDRQAVSNDPHEMQIKATMGQIAANFTEANGFEENTINKTEPRQKFSRQCPGPNGVVRETIISTTYRPTLLQAIQDREPMYIPEQIEDVDIKIQAHGEEKEGKASKKSFHLHAGEYTNGWAINFEVEPEDGQRKDYVYLSPFDAHGPYPNQKELTPDQLTAVLQTLETVVPDAIRANGCGEVPELPV